MSWTKDRDSLKSIREAFDEFIGEKLPHTQDLPLCLDIWEKTTEFPMGRWLRNNTDQTVLTSPCELRVVFAPTDYPNARTRQAYLDLYQALDIPRGFAEERTRSVSHSFGTRVDCSGSCVWFHFLCKHVRLLPRSTRLQSTTQPQIKYHAGADQHGCELGAISPAKFDPLPQADYSYIRSAFFLRGTPHGSTLVCFGRSKATVRLEEFIENNNAWTDAIVEPFVLFDLVFEGLFSEVDQNVWNMNDVFGPMEHQTLTIANSSNFAAPPFVALHNVAKHIIHLSEAIEANLLVVDNALDHIKYTSDGELSNTGVFPITREVMSNSHERIPLQLRERLLYRKSLFQSTKLRLGSLQKRVDNAINLAFNTLTQQDSRLMMRDSNTMKVIAAITLCFLPLTAVAAVMGSQLFLADNGGGQGPWIVSPSPLLPTFWYVAAIVTVVSIILAVGWLWKLNYARTGNKIKRI